MAGLAAFFSCVAIADLARTSRRGLSAPRLVFASAAGLVVGAAWCVWLEPAREGTWAWLAGAVALLTWIWASSVALGASVTQRRVTIAGSISAIGLIGGAGAMLAAGDVGGKWPTFGDLSWADPPVGVAGGLDRVLLISALLLVQLSTANILVRMLLSAAGVPAESNENEVKGGRWLGPMERIFILGFGAAGEFTAASAVVAAKALLRLPEVNNSEEGGDGSPAPKARSRLAERSEYLLLGSFASWLIAASSIALTLVPS